MTRFVKDLAATAVLRFAVVLLMPVLLVFGRSLRAKLFGVRAICGVGSAALAFAAAAVNLSVAANPARFSPDAAALLLLSANLPLGVMLALDFGLHVTRPPRSAEFAEGWSSVESGRRGAGTAEATVAVENDFVGLAVQVFTRLNPMLTRRQARTIRDTLADDLEAMAERPRLERLPSMLSWELAFDRADPYGVAPDRGQAYVYCPPHAKGERLPLVVVCHGHGGNPLVGCLPWEELADELGFVAAFPTFGYGNWEHPDGVEAILKCRRAVTERFPVDDARAVLAGISQGGCGVSRAAVAARWAGLVYVSATMELPLFTEDSLFAGVWPGRPVLVAQGGLDINVRPRSVDAAVVALRAIGVAVTYVQDAAADHFYFFEKRDEFAARFRAWWPTAVPPTA